MSTQATELVTKEEALEMVTKFIEQPGIDVETLLECFKWQGQLALWILQDRNQGTETPLELVRQLTIAQGVPEMAKIVARLLSKCGIHGVQQIGHELSRMVVTSPGLARE